MVAWLVDNEELMKEDMQSLRCREDADFCRWWGVGQIGRSIRRSVGGSVGRRPLPRCVSGWHRCLECIGQLLSVVSEIALR